MPPSLITFLIISTQMTYSYMSLSSEDFNDLSAMEICAVDDSRWFVENALLLNPDKTEAVVFGTRKRLPQLHLSRGIDVSGTRIDFTESIKLLGVVLDASLTFEKHVLKSYVDAIFTSEHYGTSDHF